MNLFAINDSELTMVLSRVDTYKDDYLYYIIDDKSYTYCYLDVLKIHILNVSQLNT